MPVTEPASKRVLVVEDHDDVRQALSMLLKIDGYDVLSFPDAQHHVDQMVAFCPEYALLDVQMPGRTGDELARELLARCPLVRVIFLTGQHDTERLKAAVPSCLVIRKPVDTDVLLQLLACM